MATEWWDGLIKTLKFRDEFSTRVKPFPRRDPLDDFG